MCQVQKAVLMSAELALFDHMLEYAPCCPQRGLGLMVIKMHYNSEQHALANQQCCVKLQLRGSDRAGGQKVTGLGGKKQSVCDGQFQLI